MKIVTKYHGPTDTKGSRITAKTTACNAKPKQATISYPYELSCTEGHTLAAQTLLDRQGWPGDLNVEMRQTSSTDSGFTFDAYNDTGIVRE